MVTRRAFVGSAIAAAAGSAATRAPVQAARVRADRFDPWIEVERAALAHNLGEVRRLAQRPVLAVLKNNAYGLGLTNVAAVLEPMDGIAGFAVVRAEEAAALRAAGVRKRVLLMARADERESAELVAQDVELAVFSYDDAARLSPIARGTRRVQVQFYIDTGMGRMGVPFHRALPLMHEIASLDAFRVRGAFTELAEDREFDAEQLRNFATITKQARDAGVVHGPLHAAASNGVFHLAEARYDLVRPGIALYGGYPSRPDEERALATLRAAVRLCCRVVRVERLRPGDSVSYGRRWIARQPTWVATLPIGHADGYPREAVQGASVRIGDRLYPVIGAVSASHTIVEVGAEERVHVGDVVTLIGPDEPSLQPNGLAAAIGVSVYDVLMHLNPALPRIMI